MSLIAFRLLKVKPTEKYTYGYKKTTILVALFNAAILLVSLGAIGYEALHRLADPQPLPGKTISIVAAIGILVNTITALLFMRNKDSDLNIRSAFSCTYYRMPSFPPDWSSEELSFSIRTYSGSMRR